MRTKHPFYMYDLILEQSAAIKEVISRNTDSITTLRKYVENAHRVFLVGTGTSYHAAWSSSFILRSKYPDQLIKPVQAIDFALYESDTKPDDLVVIFSHRGTKRYSLQSLERAKKNGSKAVLATGLNPARNRTVADLVIETVKQEESSAHTISYTTSVALFAGVVGYRVDELASLIAHCLDQEEAIKKMANQVKEAHKIWVVGAGPSEVLARETALKIKETSYLSTEGVGTEELIHGPFQAAQSSDLFIVVAPTGKAQDRTMQLLPAIDDIGASYILLSDKPVGNASLAAKQTVEELVPFSCLPFLQLLTYYTALNCGTNPDNFRLENPKYKRAFERNSM